MSTLTPAAPRLTGLQRIVAGLAVGDRVRVTFSDGEVKVGALRKSGLSILDGGTTDARLLLDTFPYPLVRNYAGLPAASVQTIEQWDDDARFDLLMDWAADYLMKAEAAQTCPKSEQGPRQLEAEEAKAAFIAEWMRGDTR